MSEDRITFACDLVLIIAPLIVLAGTASLLTLAAMHIHGWWTR